MRRVYAELSCDRCCRMYDRVDTERRPPRGCPDLCDRCKDKIADALIEMAYMEGTVGLLARLVPDVEAVVKRWTERQKAAK